MSTHVLLILKKQEQYSIHLAFLQNSLALQHWQKKKKNTPSNQKFSFTPLLFFVPVSSLMIFHFLPLLRFKSSWHYIEAASRTLPMTKVTAVTRSASRQPATKNLFYEGPGGQIHSCSRASPGTPSTQPPPSKRASSAWPLLAIPLCSLTRSLPKLFLPTHPRLVRVGERTR